MTKLELLNQLFNQFRNDNKIEQMKLIQELIKEQTTRPEPPLVLRLG